MTLPTFESALSDFHHFLSINGHSTNLCWVFRDDLLSSHSNNLICRSSHCNQNLQLVIKAYNEARVRGLVKLVALAGNNDITICTIWFPRTAKDEIQGWNQGIKFQINIPFLLARPQASSIKWFLLMFYYIVMKGRERFPFVASRAWAAA